MTTVRKVLAVLTGIVLTGVLLAVVVAPATAFAASQPVIEGVSVRDVTGNDAVLEATINPEGLSGFGAYLQFQVVANTNEYLSEIVCPERMPPGWDGCAGTLAPGALPIGGVPNGTSGESVSLDLSTAGMTLKPDTTYHYRVLAAKAVVTEDVLEWEGPPVYSADRTFTTPAAAAPSIEGQSASHVTSTDATLEATINPEDAERGAHYQFQLATDPSEYLSEFACPAEWVHTFQCSLGRLDAKVEGLPIGDTAAGVEGKAVSLDLAHAGVSLKPGATYHYRVITARIAPSEDGFNWEGPLVTGPDQTFTTPPASAAPKIDSVSVSHLTPSDATLEAQIDTEGESTMYEFLMWYTPCAVCEYIAIFKIDLPSGLLLPSFQDQSVSLDLNSVGVTLRQGAEYGYSMRATNASGSTEAQWQTFQPPPGALDPPGSTVSPGPVSEEPTVPLGGGQPAGPGASSSPAPKSVGSIVVPPNRRSTHHKPKSHKLRKHKHSKKAKAGNHKRRKA